MIKKIKEYFRKRKLQKLRAKEIQHEVLETLCTICLYLHRDGHFDRNPHSMLMLSHFGRLKKFSESIRDELREGDPLYGSKRDIK